MRLHEKFLIIIVLLLVVMAIYKESKEQKNSYEFCKPKPKDSENTLFYKLKKCFKIESNHVKWRRSLIFSFLFTVIIQLLFKISEFSVIFMMFSLFYTIYFFAWAHHASTLEGIPSEIAASIIKELKGIKIEGDKEKGEK